MWVSSSIRISGRSGGLRLFEQFGEFSLQGISPQVGGNYTAIFVEEIAGRNGFDFVKRNHGRIPVSKVTHMDPPAQSVILDSLDPGFTCLVE
jgi:hypothetical protein